MSRKSFVVAFLGLVIVRPVQADTAEALPHVGVAQCDEFLAKYLRCVDDKIARDASSRKSIHESLRDTAQAWHEAAATPEGKSALESACGQIIESTRQATASMGCDWDSPAKPSAGDGGDLPPPPDVAAPPRSASRTRSGLATLVVTPGRGKQHPAIQDTVTVQYTGWTTDGRMFDSSVKRDQPASFPMRGVIPGFSEGLALMVEGETRRLWIPVELAYKHQPGRPDGLLVFDVELVSIQAGPKPVPAPVDVAAPPSSATRTQSGLATRLVTAGKGKKHPAKADVVKLEVTAWTAQGAMVAHETRETRMDELPASLAEGLALMVVGETRRMWIPPRLNGPGTSGATTFDVHLLALDSPSEKPDLTAPADVAAPPPDAQTTTSGLSTKVLLPGTGTVHPTGHTTVRVHYTGWTTDGEMFDSSYTRNQPAEFPLDGVIKGWSEGVQLMVVGEKRRLWIPEELAYQGKDGPPKGMLVFDVELVAITRP